jgi:hypothetical protein
MMQFGKEDTTVSTTASTSGGNTIVPNKEGSNYHSSLRVPTKTFSSSGLNSNQVGQLASESSRRKVKRQTS